MARLSKLKIILVTSIMLFLLNFNSSITTNSINWSENIDNISSSLEYYTTSPIEYFNETKHPRYNLVAQPIDLIVSPNKGSPVIAEFNENFTVTINSADLPDNWELYLVNTDNEVDLEILDHYNSDDGRVLTVQPSLNVAGLYDLQFNSSTGDDYQTHSVKIVEEKEYPFKFLHLSDSHFPCYGEINTTDINLKYIEYIKTLDLDFVIFTGDLIEGGPAWLFVNPEDDKPLAAEIQLRLGLWALDLLDLPVYIVGGNHDLDDSPILPDNPRQIWEKYLGENPIIKFEYLDWMYVGYSVTDNGLSSSQYTFVKEVIGAADSNNIPSVMFYHSNYASQASDIRKLYSIEVMLYGHEHDERLYTKDHTLYHCEAPMFENSSSIFIVMNGTSMSLDDIVYDFSLLLQETSESSFSRFLILVLVPLFVLCLIKKRTKKKMR
ncbi:MAG: metallophosphoesterase [Candidatus Heimdallarchaeota archaeon]|nr:metallophosphoesterase [Candidatus Heimdallarchaeota archaeon]MCK4877127.1 metallophosphoesterase [Candidatus Heimdallarchaeota archaeon]